MSTIATIATEIAFTSGNKNLEDFHSIITCNNFDGQDGIYKFYKIV